MSSDPQLFTLISAELLLVIVRSRDLITIGKSKRQRTKQEQYLIDRGLRRSFLLEALVLVPASATLLLFIAPLILPGRFFQVEPALSAMYSVLGICSYGFPFATIRTVMTRVALNTLKDFAVLVPDEARKPNAHLDPESKP